jgi:hypothetical protein
MDTSPMPAVPTPPAGPVIIGSKSASFKPLVNESIEDVGKTAHDYIKNHYQKQLKIGIAGSVVFEILAIYFLYSAYSSGVKIDPRAILILTAPFFIYGAFVASIGNKIRHQFYRQFAQANGFSYTEQGWLDGLIGSIFSIGHDKKQEDIVTGQFLNDQVVLLNYTYITGQGKNQETHKRTIFKIGLQNQLPPLMLISNRQFMGFDSWFPNARKVALEGNFNEFFTLYVEDKFEVEALQIFNPAFMQTTLDKWKEFSMEFVGKQLYIYAGWVITTKQELNLMFDLVEYLIQKLNPELAAMETTITSLETATKTAIPVIAGGAGNVAQFSKAAWVILGAVFLVFFGILFAIIFSS